MEPSTTTPDGTPTNTSNYTTAYTYDGDGNVLTVTAVQPAGTPSQTTQYVYGVSTATGSAINCNDLLAATLYPDPTTGLPSSSPASRRPTPTTRLGEVTSMTRTVTARRTTTAMTCWAGRRQTPSRCWAPEWTARSAASTRPTISQGNAYLFTSLRRHGRDDGRQPG